MGHSSIQVTVDIYGNLIPGADISCVDQLDKTPQESANYPQTPTENPEGKTCKLLKRIGCHPGSHTH